MHKWTGWRSKVVANVKSLSPAYVLEWVDAMARHSQIHTNAQIECVLSGSLIPFRLFSHRIFCVRLSWLILFVLIEFVSHCLREEEKKDEYNECVLRQSSVCICNEVWHTTHRRKIIKRWKKKTCVNPTKISVFIGEQTRFYFCASPSSGRSLLSVLLLSNALRCVRMRWRSSERYINLVATTAVPDVTE